MMKRGYFFLSLLFSLNLASAQSSQYTGIGNWSNATNWSNGIPSSSVNATVGFGGRVLVDAIGECNDLSLFISSIEILSGGQLTINGQFNATTQGDNINDGTLILKGTLKPAVGNVVLTMGSGGGLTLEGGLEFSNFSIERTNNQQPPQ